MVCLPPLLAVIVLLVGTWFVVTQPLPTSSRPSSAATVDPARLGATCAVVRAADRGSLVAAGGEVVTVEPQRADYVIDEVGAGDAYAAGFVFGLLQRWEPAACARAGHVIAGWALRGTGDWETLPRLDEVCELLH